MRIENAVTASRSRPIVPIIVEKKVKTVAKLIEVEQLFGIGGEAPRAGFAIELNGRRVFLDKLSEDIAKKHLKDGDMIELKAAEVIQIVNNRPETGLQITYEIRGKSSIKKVSVQEF